MFDFIKDAAGLIIKKVSSRCRRRHYKQKKTNTKQNRIKKKMRKPSINLEVFIYDTRSRAGNEISFGPNIKRKIPVSPFTHVLFLYFFTRVLNEINALVLLGEIHLTYLYLRAHRNFGIPRCNLNIVLYKSRMAN